jgi:hypothetical protein
MLLVRNAARAHSVKYPSPRHDAKRPTNIASTRDPEASDQLAKALFERGFGFGESILNYPAEERRYDLLPIEALHPVDVPFVQEQDLLYLTTRPPLSDGHHADRKKVEPGNTDLERLLFLHFWRYFEICSRSHVKLTEEAATFLAPGRKNRARMIFYQEGCRYQYLQAPGRPTSRREPLGDRTAAFLVRVDELVPGGPGLVAAWGQDAQATLAWCTLLRHRYSGLLDNRGLTIVEFEPGPEVVRPSSHAWARGWHAQVILETGVELPPRPEEIGLVQHLARIFA